MAGTVMPSPVFTGIDNNGNPLAGGKLTTQAAGTTDSLATYSDAALSSPNANPVILDAGGRAVVYLSNDTAYKFVLKTSADVEVWSQDNIQSVQNIPLYVAHESIPLFGTDEVGDNALSYPAGNAGDKVVPGSQIVTLAGSAMAGTWKLRGMVRGDGTTPNIDVGFMNLTDADTTELANLSSTSTVGAKTESSAITFATGSKDYGCKIKSDDTAKYGFAYGLELVRTA